MIFEEDHILFSMLVLLFQVIRLRIAVTSVHPAHELLIDEVYSARSEVLLKLALQGSVPLLTHVSGVNWGRDTACVRCASNAAVIRPDHTLETAAQST